MQLACQPSSLASVVSEPSIPLPLLVTGVAGVVGFNAFHYFRHRFPGQVIGVRQQDNALLHGADIVACDAEDRDGLARLFDERPFRAVLDCAGNCALRACELDPDLAWRVNVDGVKNLLPPVIANRARLVHLSIDHVFSGLRDGGYTEDDTPDPLTYYGKTMVAAEEVIAREYPEACVLRISLPMGISVSGHAGAIDWIQSRFKKGRPATLYYDEVRTPTYASCMSRLFHIMLANDLAGVYHASSPRRLTLFEIAQVINRVGDYDPDLLHGCPRADAGPMPPRAGNICLDSSKLLAALGFQPFAPWPLEEHCVPTDRRWHYDRPGHELRSLARLAEVLYRNPQHSDPLPPAPWQHGNGHRRARRG